MWFCLGKVLGVVTGDLNPKRKQKFQRGWINRAEGRQNWRCKSGSLWSEKGIIEPSFLRWPCADQKFSDQEMGSGVMWGDAQSWMACQIGVQHGLLRSSKASGGGWRGGQTEPRAQWRWRQGCWELSQRGRDWAHHHVYRSPVTNPAFLWCDLQLSSQFQSLLILTLNYCCCCSVAKLCPPVCGPLDCSSRLPCPSLSPGVCSNSCPWSQWCHSTISSSVFPFFFFLKSFPASGSSPMSQFFSSGSQSTGASVLAAVFPGNIQDWFLLGLMGLISLLSRGGYAVFSSTTIWKHQLFSAQASLWSNIHIHIWLLEKP